jgi:hypothetical protein
LFVQQSAGTPQAAPTGAQQAARQVPLAQWLLQQSLADAQAWPAGTQPSGQVPNVSRTRGWGVGARVAFPLGPSPFVFSAVTRYQK